MAPDARSLAVAAFTSGSACKFEAKATGTVNTSELVTPAPIVAFVALKLVCPLPPVTVPQFALPLAVQMTLAVSVTPAGSASATDTLSASVRPVLVTVTV